ncbi:MAG TPA: laccase domain-containing protein [Bacilli bacterium]|nr:laccase domain-containing protein [Bacilli bacterium]
MRKVFIFNSTIEDGIMLNKSKVFPGLSQDEIDNICIENQKKFLKKYNLDYSNLVLIDQKDSSNVHDENHQYPDGYCIKLHNPTKKPQYTDMVMIDKDSNIILGERSGDCPIMVAYTNDLLVLCHIGATYIDRLLPQDAIKRLIEENVNPKDIKVYVSPNIHKESYVYDKYPKWAKSYVWKDAIENRDSKYYIDLDKAIELQLLDVGILKENIEFSNIDTNTNPNYYSHSAYVNGNKNKLGRFIVCAMFKDE